MIIPKNLDESGRDAGSGCSSDLDCCVYSPGSCDGADCL